MIACPVLSPTCSSRFRVAPPQRASRYPPFDRVNSTPSSSSQWMADGASLVSISTRSGFAVSCELRITSSAWISGESSSPNAAWIPPCALAELHACSVVFVARPTRAPARSADGRSESRRAAADDEHVEGGAAAHGPHAKRRFLSLSLSIVIPQTVHRSRAGQARSGYTRLVATLAEIVKPTFITVAPEDTLGEVAERMMRQNVGAVIVKDFGRLIGILTERDMLRAMAARVHTSEARVRQWMTPDPITAAPDMPLEEASEVMLDNGFRHLPVVDGTTVLGVVSLRRVIGGRRQAASERPPRRQALLVGQAQADTTPATSARAPSRR